MDQFGTICLKITKPLTVCLDDPFLKMKCSINIEFLDPIYKNRRGAMVRTASCGTDGPGSIPGAYLNAFFLQSKLEKCKHQKQTI